MKLWRIASCLFDLTLATFGAMNHHFGFYTLCATLVTYTRELKNLEERSRFAANSSITSSKNMEVIWKENPRLVIIFNIFTIFGSVFFYAGKIMAFTCSVIGTFYLIRYGLTDYVSWGIAMLVVQAVIFYNLCLGNAYKITDTMNDVLQNLKRLPRSQLDISMRELKQRIRSVRALSLTEGGLRRMGRETTPEFIDFYVNQVIALILAF